MNSVISTGSFFIIKFPYIQSRLNKSRSPLFQRALVYKSLNYNWENTVLAAKELGYIDARLLEAVCTNHCTIGSRNWLSKVSMLIQSICHMRVPAVFKGAENPPSLAVAKKRRFFWHDLEENALSFIPSREFISYFHNERTIHTSGTRCIPVSHISSL